MNTARWSRLRRLFFAGVLTVALVGASAAPALAEHDGPNGNAGCQGILSEANSKHGPPRQAVAQFFKQVHEDLGIPPGVVMSAIAQAEGESLEECFIAFFVIAEELGIPLG